MRIPAICYAPLVPAVRISFGVQQPARAAGHNLMGHSQINATMTTYSHVLPDLQREAAARLDELLTGEGTP